MATTTNVHTIFANDANEFNPEIVKEINLRSNYYSQGLDSQLSNSAYEWTYKKTSWAILRPLERVTSNNFGNDTGTNKLKNLAPPSGSPNLVINTPFKVYFPDATNVYTGQVDEQYRDEYVPSRDNNIKTSYESPDADFTKVGYGPTYQPQLTWPTIDLSISRSSGIPDTTTTTYEYGQNSMYPYTGNIPDIYNSYGIIKQPLLQHVEITNEGPFGLSQKVTISFLVFDKNQLDKSVEAYMKPGKLIEVSYGWSVYKENPAARQGTIRATVTTYNWSVNSDGSFTCNLTAVAKGSYMASAGINSSYKQLESKIFQGQIPDEIKYRNLYYGATLADIISNLDLYRLELFSNPFINNEIITNTRYRAWQYNPERFDSVTGFVVYKLPISFEHQLSDGYNENSEHKGELTLQTYIRLDSLIHIINTILLSNTSVKQSKFIMSPTYSCVNDMHDVIKLTGPADCTKFVFPTECLGSPNLVSNISTPNAKVMRDSQQSSTMIDFRVTEFAEQGPNKFQQDRKLYVGAILVNIQFIKYRILRLTENSKDVNSYKDLLESIFKILSDDLGGMVQLSLTERGDNIIISDLGFSPDRADNIKPLMIPALSKNSIVRGLEMSAQIPDSFAARVAIYSRSPESSQSIGVGEVETKEMIDEKKKKFLYELFTLNKTFTGLTTGLLSNNQIDNASYTKYTSSVRSLYNDMRESIVGWILSHSKEYKNPAEDIFQLKTALVPIKLKFILDGIQGFLFGNALTTNWLPTPYDSDRILFTVYRVYHKIHDHDWITEVECLYRTR